MAPESERAMQRSEFIGQTDTEILFRFRCECEDCDAYGEIALLKKDGMKPFGCPEGCGATYVPWQRNGVLWQLKCVVLPQYYPRGDRELAVGAGEEDEHD